MGATGSPGLQARNDINPKPTIPPRPLDIKNSHLLGAEIQELLDKGAVTRVFPCPSQFLSQIILVPKKDGSYIPVINLRSLNQYMEQVHFKMESLAMMRDLLRQDDWMASIDLKDAYLSVTSGRTTRNTFGSSGKRAHTSFAAYPLD